MKKITGFSLVELMIVVAILGILASIGYPSYREHVLKSERALAQTALVSLSSEMERYYSENNTYSGAGVPAIFPNVVPIDGGTVTHNLSITISDNGMSYNLIAKPVDSAEDTLELSSSGIRKRGSKLSWRD